jgi:hypothetical protein
VLCQLIRHGGGRGIGEMCHSLVARWRGSNPRPSASEAQKPLGFQMVWMRILRCAVG